MRVHVPPVAQGKKHDPGGPVTLVAQGKIDDVLSMIVAGL